MMHWECFTAAALCIALASTAVAEYGPDPDQLQGLGLHTLAERQGHKPWDLYMRDDGLLTRRTVFRDRQFGTQVWMLDDSHSMDHCNTASVWPAWNADGSLLYLPGRRVGPDGVEAGWFVNADYSRLIRAPDRLRPVWDRQNRDVLFTHEPGRLVDVNARTGDSRTVAEWQPYPRERVYGLTRDNRFIFLDTPNGGMWVTYQPEGEPIPQWGLHDGRPEAPQQDGTAPRPPEGGTILNIGRHTVAETDQWGHIFRIRVGMLIDRETGQTRHVIAPLDGHETYLRAFISDRVNFPTDAGWEQYQVHRSETCIAVGADAVTRYARTSPHCWTAGK